MEQARGREIRSRQPPGGPSHCRRASPPLDGHASLKGGKVKQLSITGGSGFLGGHLVSECLSRADIALRLLTRSSDTMGHPSCERVTLFQGDLIDPSTLDGFLQPDATLIHLAYLHQSGSANIEAAGNIARAALRAGVTRVVHCSTAVVVGFGAGGVITEDTPPSPRGEYQETKYAV